MYDREAGILFPIILYAKADKDDVSAAEIKAAFFELRNTLKQQG